MIRAQYHLRPSPRGLLAWDVRRLVELSRNLPVRQVPVSSIAEVDENHWYFQDGAVPTCRSILEHIELIQQADLSWPIILGADGRLMDGMHRVCRALLEKVVYLPAVQFEQDPEPDFVGRSVESLPYE